VSKAAELRAALAHRLAQPRLYSRLFGPQRVYRDDRSRRKAALCTRRAGKTEGTASTLIDDAIDYPGSVSLYLALTHKSAKRIIWPILKKLIADRIDCKPNETDLSITFTNGSIIVVGGAETDADVEKYRGWKLRRCVVDEAASFGNRLRYIIEEVLEPALFDLLGDLELIGTPSASCVGYFHDVTMGKVPGWSVHKWSVLDNPHIPHAKVELERMMAERGWDANHPVYLREWCGRWVRDDSSLVYGRFTRADNVFSKLPKDVKQWSNVLGIDIGYDDPVAFGVATFAYGHPNIYLRGGWHRSGMIVSELAAKAAEYIETYKPIKVVMDTGGLGKMIAEEIRIRYDLPIEPAEKSEKPAMIELLNSDFKTKRALVEEGDPAIDEYETIQWDTKRVGKEDEQYPNDLSDAKLYAYREARHWTFKAKQARPAKGTPERATLEAEEAFNAAAERAQQRGKPRSPYGV
jgi:hypothetical protein